MLALIAAFVAWQAVIGADALWPVAVGRSILDTGRLPARVPFAAADSPGWANVPVLGELVLTAVAAVGDRALAAVQVAAGVVALGLLAGEALRRGGRDRTVAVVVGLVALAGASTLVVIRLQVLSLVPFALLLLLLHRDHGAPGRRIWLLPVLVALWTNLHGAVVLGVAVAGCYLLFSRIRAAPWSTVAVGLVTVLALAVNPAGPGTVRYYLGVFTNEAARRGAGLWAHPSLHQPLDVVMVLALLALAALALRRRQELWMYAALAGLALSTASAARNGVWLSMALVIPAAAPALRERPAPALPARRRALAGWAALVVLAVGVVLGLRTAPVDTTPAGLVPAVRELARGSAVLAPEPLVERLAADGVRVWIGNPIDAFPGADQTAYLDFLDGLPGGRAALARVDVVVVESGSAPERLVLADPAWRLARTIGVWGAYAR